MNRRRRTYLVLIAIGVALALVALRGLWQPVQRAVIDRETALPNDIAKRGPTTDRHPPILHSSEFEQPVPLPYPINTAGGEDSPFILPDGNTLYFFFTPDVRVPHSEQLSDGVTGIYVARRVGDAWGKPTRVWLCEPDKLTLDGAPYVRGDEMWFASARQGYAGLNMFTARQVDGEWREIRYAGEQLMKQFEIGEVHLHGDQLFFHSRRAGGKGDYDIWVTTRDGTGWTEPVSIDAINTGAVEGWPFVSSDGTELWFTRVHLGTPAVFRSELIGGVWGAPELIVSQFAGEPTLDAAGSLIFVHHFYEDGVMIEVDLYVAARKSQTR